MKTAWLKLSAIGLVGVLGASACKVEVTDGEGGTGGTNNSTGGKNTGGTTTATGGIASTGGKTSTGGTTSTGGKTSTGGVTATGGATATGGKLGCSNTGDKSTPLDSCDFPKMSQNDPIIGACIKCITRACCTEVEACFGTDPDNQCGYGGLETPGESEFICYQDCLVKKGKARGGQYEPDDMDTCANDCATPACGVPPVGDQTQDLIICMHASCDDECFVTPAM